MSADKLIYSWDDYDNSIKFIHNKLLAGGWTPDYIVGVKRGGLIPAVSLSHRLNKPLIMMSCQLRDSDDNEVRLYEVENISKGKTILIVDDICDSGITLTKIILNLVYSGFKTDNIKTCSLIFNKAQNFNVDYTCSTIDRLEDKRWIIFPWE